MKPHLPPIPERLSHLRVDPRGFVIPFFVRTINGKPDFRYQHVEVQQECLSRKVCPICGFKLPKDYCYFITGPVGMKNGVASDPPMHRECAEYSLQACPHMYFEKAERRTDTNPSEYYLIAQKPVQLNLIKAPTNFNFHQLPSGGLIAKYQVKSWEPYIYENGTLVKFDPKNPDHVQTEKL